MHDAFAHLYNYYTKNYAGISDTGLIIAIYTYLAIATHAGYSYS